MSSVIRQPAHAGSWYSDDKDVLSNQLESYLSSARPGSLKEGQTLKALIGPHAGYSYSGRTAAFGYVDIQPEKVSKIFLLGPSHHVYLDGCAISGASIYRTPVGDIEVDAETCKELEETGEFRRMNLRVDEEEHSLEMHLPYIAHVMKGHDFTLVPIMVGSINATSEKKYGDLLSKYFDEPGNLFIISSDFCHWGTRFRYTFFDKAQGQVWNSIEKLDKMGMELIEKKSAREFREYLEEYENTICGRHPISIFLQVLDHCESTKVQFVHYEQSSKCKSTNDSSVSYASAICFTN
jgi:AmmeMemoRadiSam system protein B